MEFPGQESDLSMAEGREVKGSPRPEGHLWVQTGTKGERSPLTENAFLSLRGSLRYPSVCPSDCKHFFLSQLFQDNWVDVFKLGENVPLNI